MWNQKSQDELVASSNINITIIIIIVSEYINLLSTDINYGIIFKKKNYSSHTEVKYKFHTTAPYTPEIIYRMQ